MNAEINSQQKTRRDPDYEARLERIGDILARGVARMLAKERAEQEEDTRTHELPQAITLSRREVDLLALLQRFGSIRPREIRDHMEGSRATVARLTAGLVQKGLIRRRGKTSATSYSLTRTGREALKSIQHGELDLRPDDGLLSVR